MLRRIPWFLLALCLPFVLHGEMLDEGLADDDAYPTRVRTEAFDFELGKPWRSGWRFDGLLQGQGWVDEAGVLHLKLTRLDLARASVSDEAEPTSCRVRSARLMLTRDVKDSFHTLAASDELVLDADLCAQQRWSLQPDGHELRLPLPAMLGSGTRWRLQLNTEGQSWVFLDATSPLQVHQALAVANNQPDPCRALDLSQLIQRHCAAELARRLQPGAIEVAPDALNDALHQAAELGRFELLAPLLAAGADPRSAAKPPREHAALLNAAAADNVEALAQLAAAGADLNAHEVGAYGAHYTALSMAVHKDADRAVRWLLARGATPELDDPTGWTLLHIAADGSALRVLPLLLATGADVNRRSHAERHPTPLMTAARLSSPAFIQALLAAGADPEAVDTEGKSVCDWAQFFKRGPQVQALVCRAPAS